MKKIFLMVLLFFTKIAFAQTEIHSNLSGFSYIQIPALSTPMPALSIFPSTPVSGFSLFANNTGLFSWKGTNGFTQSFNVSANTADRTYTLPNASGTFVVQAGLDAKQNLLATFQRFLSQATAPATPATGFSLFADNNNQPTISGPQGANFKLAYNTTLQNTAIGINVGTVQTGDLNTLLGYNAGNALTSGREIVAIGANALQFFTGDIDPIQNGLHVAIGSYAARNLLAGSIDNVFVGQKAGLNATLFSNSVVIGAHAGANISTGSDNVIIGRAAQEGTTLHTANSVVTIGTGAGGGSGVKDGSVTIGRYAGRTVANSTANIIIGASASELSNGSFSNSTIIGASAGNKNVGNFNVFLGNGSGNNNTTGTGNMALGYLALPSVTTASKNTGIGYNVGNLTSGGGNTLIGYETALQLTTGTDNVAIGADALRFGATSSANVVLGNQAGNRMVGNGNILLGYQAGYFLTAGNDIMIGYRSGVSITNTAGDNVFVGNSTGENANATSQQNTFIGARAGNTITSGYKNTFIGNGTGNGITTGNNNTIIGSNISGLSATLTNSIILRDGNGGLGFFKNASGNFGIGTETPNASAVLDIPSTTRGVLLPRMTTTQRDAITTPAEGLEIFNSTTKTKDFFNGTVWKTILTN